MKQPDGKTFEYNFDKNEVRMVDRNTTGFIRKTQKTVYTPLKDDSYTVHKLLNHRRIIEILGYDEYLLLRTDDKTFDKISKKDALDRISNDKAHRQKRNQRKIRGNLQS